MTQTSLLPDGETVAINKSQLVGNYIDKFPDLPWEQLQRKIFDGEVKGWKYIGDETKAQILAHTGLDRTHRKLKERDRTGVPRSG